MGWILLDHGGRIDLVDGRNCNFGGELRSFRGGLVGRSRGASHCDLLRGESCAT